MITTYTDEKFPREVLAIRQYKTPNLPAHFYVEANGKKITDTTHDLAAAQAALEALARVK